MLDLFNDKKAIGAVIATGLLLIVAVGSIVAFQSWYQGFESKTFSDVDTKSDDASGNTLGIETLVGNTLYVKNDIVDNLSIKSLSIGGIDCNISGQENLNLSINEIDISLCLENVSTSTPDITLITDKKVSSKKVYLKSLSVSVSSGSGGVSSTSLNCTTDVDGDGYISYTCALYPMTDTSFEGKFDLDDSSSTIQVTDYCWLKTNKSGCESNFIVDGCGSGTVLDVGTGFCWQKNMSTSGTMIWSNAFTYCDGLTLGGYSDWYLPSREEFITIIDMSRSNPSVIGGNNKFTNIITDNNYWTASTYGPDNVRKWRVELYDGFVRDSHETNVFNVNCVRKN